MSDFIKVARMPDLPPGSTKSVDVSGTSVALFNVGGAIHATSNTCPHRGGPLGEGSLANAVVSCPWHNFQFDVTNGECLGNPSLKVACFPVRVEGEDILIQI